MFSNYLCVILSVAVLSLLYLLNEALKGVVNACRFALTLCVQQTLVFVFVIQLNPNYITKCHCSERNFCYTLESLFNEVAEK